MGFNSLFSWILVICGTTQVIGDWVTQPPYYGQNYRGAGGARGIVVDPSGDLLMMSRGSYGVELFYETENGDGTIDIHQMKVVAFQGLSPDLNHGLIYHDGYIYASNTNAVFRWPYTPGSRTPVTAQPETVINGMPGGGHDTRTMIFDSQNRLYVQVGSGGNVDQDSSRSRIRRFNLVGLFPIPYDTGELFADGLRNEVGLAFDENGVLWGVENGADNLNRPDFGDIHNGNPAEELNKFDGPVGTHYGYPYCFSTHNLPGNPPGTQFAWPSFMNDGVHTDDWCKNTANNKPPALAMPAHVAPLGIDFLRATHCDAGPGSFPCSMRGNAVVSWHGSWNSDVKVGYGVRMIPFNGGNPTDAFVNVVIDENVPNCQNCYRPVGVVFHPKGYLFVSADGGSSLVKVTYGQPPPPIRNSIQHNNTIA